MWDEIQDMPGEIFDIEDFNEMKKELFELIDACVELEAEGVWQSDKWHRGDCKCPPSLQY